VAPVDQPHSMFDSSLFRLLNVETLVTTASDWNLPGQDKLLTYNLHYFDDLLAVDAGARKSWHRNIMERWVIDNPAGHGNGWEPYPLSLRIVNWIKWQLAGNKLSQRALESLYLQARFLFRHIEYHLLANHLLANAKALFFAGCFFQGEEARSWRRKGFDLLLGQVDEQILSDGGHYERSPMYHAIILDDFLDALNLCRAYELEDTTLAPSAANMLRWLANMTHPDGELSYFNDATFGIAPTLSNLQRYGERLQLKQAHAELPGVKLSRESGYARSDLGPGVIIFDVGDIGPDYQPGHGHCDCLSFEASVYGKRVFVNTGISTYNNCPRRLSERGTSAHNTVNIPGTEQSEIWSAFRVGRRAVPEILDIGDNFLEAAHNGFRTVGIVHRRRFAFFVDRFEINDWLDGAESASVAGRAEFHFHPDVRVSVSDKSVSTSFGRMECSGAIDISPSRYEYCLGFNNRVESNAISVKFSGYLKPVYRYENTVCQ
jgi:uncharacterized heparinase superfamily protein